MTKTIKGLPIGTKVKILEPTAGCRGAQGLTGEITNGAHNYGILSYEEGVNVVTENGDVWRVGNDTLVEIINPIKRVIFNPPATIVLWVDGTKTVAKCSKDDTFDEQTGLLICLAKHAYGHCLRLDSLLKDVVPPTSNNKRLELRVVPTIRRLIDDRYLGTLGTPTPYKDCRGKNLRVGDVVLIFSNNNQRCDSQFVCKDNTHAFIMGIDNCCNPKTGEIKRFKVKLIKSYENITPGTTYYPVTVKEV